MNIQLKPMKLIFSRNETHWQKIIEDLNGNLIYQENNIIIRELTKEYFDEWEIQTKRIPTFNIVEVVRFI
jgi:hypothetical protein